MQYKYYFLGADSKSRGSTPTQIKVPKGRITFIAHSDFIVVVDVNVVIVIIIILIISITIWCHHDTNDFIIKTFIILNPKPTKSTHSF